MVYKIQRLKNVLAKYRWWIFGSVILLIIAYPFIFLFIYNITGVCWGDLYTFGMPLKDFITPWIAFWGVLGAALGVLQVQKRISFQEKQQETQQLQFKEQIEKQSSQIQIQQKHIRDTRFLSGVDLLGNEKESARIGGAYNLYFLASEDREYLNSVCEILCAHIRTITSEKDYQKKHKESPSNEIQTIMGLLFHKDQHGNLIFNDCTKNLRSAFLCGSNFFGASLNRVKFRNSTLTNVLFSRANLNLVSFKNTTLKRVKLWEAKLSEVHFDSAVLTDVGLWDADLHHVSFCDAKLIDVSFKNAKLVSIDFKRATLDQVNFTGSVLDNCSNKEITQSGRSLELTKE